MPAAAPAPSMGAACTASASQHPVSLAGTWGLAASCGARACPSHRGQAPGLQPCPARPPFHWRQEGGCSPVPRCHPAGSPSPQPRSRVSELRSPALPSPADVCALSPGSGLAPAGIVAASLLLSSSQPGSHKTAFPPRGQPLGSLKHKRASQPPAQVCCAVPWPLLQAWCIMRRRQDGTGRRDLEDCAGTAPLTCSQR